MVGRWSSFWDGPSFKGLLLLVSGNVDSGVFRTVFWSFCHRKKRPSDSEAEKSFLSKEQKTNATYKLDVRSNGKLRHTNLKSNTGNCKWWFSRAFQRLFSGDMFNLVFNCKSTNWREYQEVHHETPRSGSTSCEVSEYRPVGLQRGDYTMELVRDG